MSIPATGAPQPRTPEKPTKPPQKKRSRGPTWLILAVLLLIGAAAAVWYVPIPGLTAPEGGAAGKQAADAASGDAAVPSPEQLTREAALAAKEKELAELAASLKERETKVNQLLKELTVQQSSVEMIRKLSAIYGSMPPAKAAQLLAGMDRTTAVEILRLLQERQTADILAAMDPPVALEMIREMTKPLPAAGAASGNG